MKNWLGGLIAAGGLLFMLAGCGGAQDPYRLDTGSTHPFFNGLWDGFVVLVVFIKDITSRADYQYYTHGAGPIYFLGYLIGILLLFLAVERLWWSVRRSAHRLR